MENTVVWDDFDDEVSLEVVRAVEGELKIHFPADYISVARVHNGGYPNKDVFDVASRGEIVFDRLLSFHAESPIYILDVYHAIRDRLPEGVYPFAEDPFGNSICFDYRVHDEEPYVVFWDHELVFEDPSKGLFPMCRSFSELLSKLYTLEE